MKKNMLKKILIGGTSIFVLLVVVLCIHIYTVTRHNRPDENTIAMARIELRQMINEGEGEKITGWLYRQKGVDHVFCNAKTSTVVFTFYPVKADVNTIVTNLKSNFGMRKAIRYVPTDAELKGGCPVAANSFSYKTYEFIAHIF